MSKQSFTHVSIWLQPQNVPIMWIDRETLTELIEAISKVEEVGTVANDDCMGEEVIKLRVSIVIIKPLMMIWSYPCFHHLASLLTPTLASASLLVK